MRFERSVPLDEDIFIFPPNICVQPLAVRILHAVLDAPEHHASAPFRTTVFSFVSLIRLPTKELCRLSTTLFICLRFLFLSFALAPESSRARRA